MTGNNSLNSSTHSGMTFLMMQICKAHRNSAEQVLTNMGLHAGQDMVLLALQREDGQTQTQLATTMCVEPPTLTKMLGRMERSGLVERRGDPDDARVSRVYLTDESRALDARVRAAWSQLDEIVVNGLSDVEQALLRRMLTQILENLNAADLGDSSGESCGC